MKTDSDESLTDRGGGGAPLRDESGNLLTNVVGKFQSDSLVRHLVFIAALYKYWLVVELLLC